MRLMREKELVNIKADFIIQGCRGKKNSEAS